MQKNVLLFEISWEVSNLVGGIHTVLASKINHAKQYADEYYCIGPYKNTTEFVREDTPSHLHNAVQELQEQGLILHFGKWTPDSQTSCNCILVEMKRYEKHANSIKAKLWENHKIDSLNSDWFDFDEVMTWSWGCGLVCETLSKQMNFKNTLVHSHEWMCSGATFYFHEHKHLKEELHIRTIFTTHATMLGRAYYGNFNELLMNKDLEHELNNKSPYQIAQELNVHTKYQTEHQALRFADKSSCVSPLSKDEIIKLYDYKEVNVTENGFSLNLSFDDCIKQFTNTHSKLTNSIQEYFKPFYKIKKHLRIGIISGRFEVKAKGYDTTFQALGELNNQLKEQDSSKDIIILAPIMAGDYKPLKEEVQLDFNQHIAPLSKYNIELSHELMQLCTRNGLLNRKEDKVKIILIPRTLDTHNKAFDMNYYELLQGCDFSLFPSGYEPWGYTPHESIAYGVITLTSENAGFGKYWLHNKINNSVVRVVLGQDYTSKVEQIKEFILEEYTKTAKTQYREKKYALEYSKELEWEMLFENYINIYNSLMQDTSK
ncbi:MAG: glycogen/starch synthase [Nanoarchaeota archaeon]|nr:glycogen/starch synthase [Nanoarchaeota archaeon]